VPRFFASLIEMGELPVGKDVWQDTTIELPADAPASWQNAFSDETIDEARRISVCDALRRFPIALLVSK
jgi:(1->4)-alpha-D-glucan 1-alpha-D-glucosylmutase